MFKILVAGSDKDYFSEMESALATHGEACLLRAESADTALRLASEESLDLVIAAERLGDTTGLELAADLLSVNPMINCSVVSGLTPEEFHEASEGLGIMTQLSDPPGEEDAVSLLRRLKQIKNLTTGRNE